MAASLSDLSPNPAVSVGTGGRGDGQVEIALPDFTSERYKDAYSRINAIVIEGEQEAHDNYLSLATLLPEQAEELARLARMEMKHKKGFTACAANLGVEADMPFARSFFTPLRDNFQQALEIGRAHV